MVVTGAVVVDPSVALCSSIDASVSSLGASVALGSGLVLGEPELVSSEVTRLDCEVSVDSASDEEVVYASPGSADPNSVSTWAEIGTVAIGTVFSSVL